MEKWRHSLWVGEICDHQGRGWLFSTPGSRLYSLTVLARQNCYPILSEGAGITVLKMSTPQLREKYLATGAIRQSDLERYCRFADDPNSWAIYYATIAVSGRKVGE